MDIRVPEELQPILRDFTKAVLRDRPDDVLQYSKQYFVSKWEDQRMGERAPCERRDATATHAHSCSRVHSSVRRGACSPPTAPTASRLPSLSLAATYVLEPSTSTQFAELAEPHRLVTETTFQRFDTDCDGSLTIDELHLMVTETASAFGLGSAAKHG